MYHERIDVESAEPLNGTPRAGVSAPGFRERALAVLIVLMLPFAALALLARFFWHDLKALGRFIALCISTYAEEFARRR